MKREFFRWFIRVIMIVTMMAGCCESCYYFGTMVDVRPKKELE